MKKNIFFYLFVITILGIGFIPGPILLGDWESLYYFQNFGSLNYSLDFRIPPRANIGTPGHSLLEVSRLFVEKFNLSLNLQTFRLPSIIYGIISILIFYIISNRYFGFFPSAIASILLAINPIFFIYQNSMTVLMVSGLGFLMVIERLQKIETEYDSWISWFGLIIALSVVSLGYGLVRIYVFLFLILWFIKLLFQFRKLNNGRILIAKLKTKIFFTIFLTVVFLCLINLKNLISLIQFKQFLFPTDSEVVIFSSKDISVNLFKTLLINSKIIFEALSGIIGEYHDFFPTNLIIGFRYVLVNPLLSIIALIGLIFCFQNIKKNLFIFSKPYLSIISLTLLCLLPLFFSTIFITEDIKGGSATLSTYRLFFLLFPVYLLIAVFIHEMQRKIMKKNFFLYFSITCVFLLFIHETHNIFKEKNRFYNLVKDINVKSEILPSLEYWTNKAKNIDRGLYMYEHFQQHSQYKLLANSIKDKIEENNYENTNLIINIDSNLFFFKKLRVIHYINNLNFNSVFLSFYLNDLGVENAWLQVINKSKPHKYLGFSKSGPFSAKLENDDQYIEYNDTDNLEVFLRYYGKLNSPKLIVTTTEIEKIFAINYFKSKKEELIVLNL